MRHGEGWVLKEASDYTRRLNYLFNLCFMVYFGSGNEWPVRGKAGEVEGGRVKRIKRDDTTQGREGVRA